VCGYPINATSAELTAHEQDCLTRLAQPTWRIEHPLPRYRHRTFAEGKQERIAARKTESEK
jgi:hypothetical protein